MLQASATPNASQQPEEAPALRLSHSLSHVPPERAPAPQVAAAPPVNAPANTPVMEATAAQAGVAAPLSALREASSAPGLLPLTIGLGGIALLTSVGWLMERRRRREEEDSILWAGVQPAASSLVTKVRSLDDILPDSPNPAESARAIYVTAIGETTSRREATLIDLHELEKKLDRRRKRGDNNAAVLLLQQHLVDFRYTSPWVFLELRELYLELGLQKEWDIARDAFRMRFGQNAPVWAAPSSAGAELLDDAQLCAGASANWPFRPTRMWILRWMLGEHETRIKALGPPLLPLGVYRDLMLINTLLDEVMPASTAYQDTV